MVSQNSSIPASSGKEAEEPGHPGVNEKPPVGIRIRERHMVAPRNVEEAVAAARNELVPRILGLLFRGVTPVNGAGPYDGQRLSGCSGIGNTCFAITHAAVRATNGNMASLTRCLTIYLMTACVIATSLSYYQGMVVRIIVY